ncbi:MAG: hypothetical protein M1300_04095, partial [Epsilonproteobacteria bacterium]|nr:hypothetical protein [Campylobacterota bacterium]
SFAYYPQNNETSRGNPIHLQCESYAVIGQSGVAKSTLQRAGKKMWSKSFKCNMNTPALYLHKFEKILNVTHHR